MDSSSSNAATGMPRFQNRFCYCKLRATIQVTNSEPNRGKLYYACPNGDCGYWNWCYPMNNERAQSVSSIQRRMITEVETENAMPRHDHAIALKLQKLEAKIGCMKYRPTSSRIKWVIIQSKDTDTAKPMEETVFYPQDSNLMEQEIAAGEPPSFSHGKNHSGHYEKVTRGDSSSTVSDV
ncbi:hypothetical protein Vadar_024074 [Vaccinium darrowii]|uniref:Uncharacterized protein n=1 Tax=Vaccinium darrowii TaxID=229202 RepID=A0ACB7YYY5_9ERIC|nr:hypothetical protein Vadar_024074 [Vaccinium darrowii]